jgi:hypothetical protein
VVVLVMTAFAQSVDAPFQARYAANLTQGASYINITNSGATGAALKSGKTADITGAICVNVYAFASDEQLVSCCSCPVTPNGLVSLEVNKDLNSNNLTPKKEDSLVIKLLATAPVGGKCTDSAAAVTSATVGVPGMLAWGTTMHKLGAAYAMTETAFAPATLSAGEAGRIGALCNFILANGSGFGVCASCTLGGQGAARQ